MRRITGTGWAMFVAAIVFSAVSIANIKVTAREATNQQNVSDSLRLADKTELKYSVDSALKKWGLQLKVDTVQKQTVVRIVDTSNKFIEPILEIIPDSSVFKGKLPDSLKVRAQYNCLNNSVAFYVRARLLTFALQDKNFIFIKRTPVVTNNTLKASQKLFVYVETGWLQIPKFLSASRINDTTFFFAKAQYRDREIGGKERIPVRTLYYYVFDRIPTSIAQMHLHYVG